MGGPSIADATSSSPSYPAPPDYVSWSLRGQVPCMEGGALFRGKHAIWPFVRLYMFFGERVERGWERRGRVGGDGRRREGLEGLGRMGAEVQMRR